MEHFQSLHLVKKGESSVCASVAREVLCVRDCMSIYTYLFHKKLIAYSCGL